MKRARVEITCEPEETTYRDEGGRHNYLFSYFVLRTPDGFDRSCLNGRDSLNDVECTLQYEDGSPVPEDGELIKLTGKAGFNRNADDAGRADRELFGSVRYRILPLSRNHNKNRFRVKIALRGVSESLVAPAITRPTLVLSKRKQLRAEQRVMEATERRVLEEQAEHDNLRLAEAAAGATARRSYNASLRDLEGVPQIEGRYPKPLIVAGNGGAAGGTNPSSAASVVSAADATDTEADDLGSSTSGRKRSRDSDKLDQVLAELASVRSTLSRFETAFSALEAHNAQLTSQLRFVLARNFLTASVGPGAGLLSRGHSLSFPGAGELASATSFNFASAHSDGAECNPPSPPSPTKRRLNNLTGTLF